MFLLGIQFRILFIPEVPEHAEMPRNILASL